MLGRFFQNDKKRDPNPEVTLFEKVSFLTHIKCREILFFEKIGFLKTIQTMQEEFYIGWQAEAPPSFAKAVRRFVIGLCLLVPALALLIVLFQNGFSNGTFEFGKTTELEGVFSENPSRF